MLWPVIYFFARSAVTVRLNDIPSKNREPTMSAKNGSFNLVEKHLGKAVLNPATNDADQKDFLEISVKRKNC